jgi:hypothetical protein
MYKLCFGSWLALLLTASLGENISNIPLNTGPGTATLIQSFTGKKPGDTREVIGIKLQWCPPGKFLMGSPPNEPDRRPDEDQVEVTLDQRFLDRPIRSNAGPMEKNNGRTAR